MRAFCKLLLSSVLFLVVLGPPRTAHAELIGATGDPHVVHLHPLRNGLSAITLVWPIDRMEEARLNVLSASLSTVISAGTENRSAYQISAFEREKGVQRRITREGSNLLLTVTAPQDVFPETLVHLEDLLLGNTGSASWYKRALISQQPTPATIGRQPGDVLGELAGFLDFERAEISSAEEITEIRFGMPTQVIIRSDDEEIKRRVNRILRKLPKAQATLPFARWAKALTKATSKAPTLPKGVIHFTDPNASEMLILFATQQRFKSENEQLAAHLLMNYIGNGQGSEMFRIIRQELRAAYEPDADFVVLGKRRALLSMSATVEAGNWKKIEERIEQIYRDVRSGQVNPAGLRTEYNTLNNVFGDRFFSNAVWGARIYLREYPDGATGQFGFPLFDAFNTTDIEKVIERSEHHLPPLDDFLLILIGGGSFDASAQGNATYCALPKNTRLTYCLDKLTSAQD